MKDMFTFLYTRGILTFITYFIIFYLFGKFSGPLKIKSIKSFVLRHSFYLTILVLGLAFFIVKDNSLQQGAFTFAGIYLGFWLSEEQKKKEENKRVKYYLGLIWQELRFNCHQLNVIKKNFNFFLDDPVFLKANHLRLTNINNLSQALKENVYQSFINSGAVTSLNTESLQSTLQESDELFNKLEIAYNDMLYLKSFLVNVLLDFSNKILIWDQIAGSVFQTMAVNDLKEKIRNLAREIAIAKRTVLNARNLVDHHLDKLGVKSDTEQLRISVLNEADENFINNCIRSKPVSIEEVNSSFQQNG